MKKLPLIIVFAALAVSAPRLAVAFVLADGVMLTPRLAAWVFSATGVASGIVLTGGNVFIATALAEHWKRRGGLWFVLLLAWVLFLAFAVVLIAPLLAYGMRHSVLAEVLPNAAQQWGWAVIAALSVEVLAAAAMGALVLSDEPTATGAGKRAGSVRDALSGRIVRALNADAAKVAPLGSAPAQPVATLSVPVEPLPIVVAPLYRCACGAERKSQQALAGHQRACSVHKAQRGA